MTPAVAVADPSKRFTVTHPLHLLVDIDPGLIAFGENFFDRAVSETPLEGIGFQGFFVEIERAINGKVNRAVTLQEGAASIALVTAIYHSARTGERVVLPLSLDHQLYNGWLL